MHILHVCPHFRYSLFNMQRLITVGTRFNPNYILNLCSDNCKFINVLLNFIVSHFFGLIFTAKL